MISILVNQGLEYQFPQEVIDEAEYIKLELDPKEIERRRDFRDITTFTSSKLPSSSGRIWYEADIGLVNTMKRSNQPSTRLLYSNDGLMYVTGNHYKSFHYLGTYK